MKKLFLLLGVLCFVLMLHAQTLKAKIKIDIERTTSDIDSAGLKDGNSLNEQKVKTTEKSFIIALKSFMYTFPAHSFTQLVIKVKP